MSDKPAVIQFDDFLKLDVGATASVYLFKIRGPDPFYAATSYAGCKTPTGECVTLVLRRLRWWWAEYSGRSFSPPGYGGLPRANRLELDG